MKKKHQSKKGWLDEHFKDEYVLKAQKEGYRSRAAYKLIEINQRDQLLKPGMTVVDLGAAPGGWLQVAKTLVGDKGRVIALDILPITPLEGVEFVLGDFQEQEVFDSLMKKLEGEKVGLVISDMAPNISGMDSVDQPKSIYLIELAYDLAKKVLKKDGDLLLKVFQGSGSEEFIRELRTSFKKVMIRKPKASRPRSREVYVLARGFSGEVCVC